MLRYWQVCGSVKPIAVRQKWSQKNFFLEWLPSSFSWLGVRNANVSSATKVTSSERMPILSTSQIPWLTWRTGIRTGDVTLAGDETFVFQTPSKTTRKPWKPKPELRSTQIFKSILILYLTMNVTENVASHEVTALLKWNVRNTFGPYLLWSEVWVISVS